MKRSLSVAIIIVPSLLSTSLPLPPEPEGGRILLVAPRVLLGPGLMNESVRALSMRCFSMVVDEASHVTTIPAEWSSETFEPPEQRRTSPSGLKERARQRGFPPGLGLLCVARGRRRRGQQVSLCLCKLRC